MVPAQPMRTTCSIHEKQQASAGSTHTADDTAKAEELEVGESEAGIEVDEDGDFAADIAGALSGFSHKRVHALRMRPCSNVSVEEFTQFALQGHRTQSAKRKRQFWKTLIQLILTKYWTLLMHNQRVNPQMRYGPDLNL
jgi:hypothetical protein